MAGPAGRPLPAQAAEWGRAQVGGAVHTLWERAGAVAAGRGRAPGGKAALSAAYGRGVEGEGGGGVALTAEERAVCEAGAAAAAELGAVGPRPFKALHDEDAARAFVLRGLLGAAYRTDPPRLLHLLRQAAPNPAAE